jgi:hypothetical protein
MDGPLPRGLQHPSIRQSTRGGQKLNLFLVLSKDRKILLSLSRWQRQVVRRKSQAFPRLCAVRRSLSTSRLVGIDPANFLKARFSLLSGETSYKPTSGQLPEPASGVGRCSTADESHAEPHAPITAGLPVIQEFLESIHTSRLQY